MDDFTADCIELVKDFRTSLAKGELNDFTPEDMIDEFQTYLAIILGKDESFDKDKFNRDCEDADTLLEGLEGLCI